MAAEQVGNYFLKEEYADVDSDQSLNRRSNGSAENVRFHLSYARRIAD